MSQKNIGFIGCGNMASSLIGGLVDSGYSPNHLWACDRDDAKLENIVAQYAVNVTPQVSTLVEKNDVIVLAVKPVHVQELLLSLQTSLADKNEPLLISVAAGIRIDDLVSWAGGKMAVVRVMPNTPALVRASVSVLCANEWVNEGQRSQAESIMRAVGLALWLTEEGLMDAVTAVSGSGPAYYFYIMEIMGKTAEAMGLDQEMARLLVLQTAYGAAKMALESDYPVAELRSRVTSPGGTTERAIQTLQNEKIEQTFDKALQAARERSVELSQPSKPI